MATNNDDCGILGALLRLVKPKKLLVDDREVAFGTPHKQALGACAGDVQPDELPMRLALDEGAALVLDLNHRPQTSRTVVCTHYRPAAALRPIQVAQVMRASVWSWSICTAGLFGQTPSLDRRAWRLAMLKAGPWKHTGLQTGQFGLLTGPAQLQPAAYQIPILDAEQKFRYG